MVRLFSFSVLMLLGITLSACSMKDDYQFKGGEISPAAAAAPLDLTDQFGQPFSLESVKGEVTLVYFGYTTCPDLCPTTLSDFIAVKEMLGDDADSVNFVLVSVDPERDTQERLADYLGFFDPAFIGLRGTGDETEVAKAGYGVVATRVEYPDSATGYLVDHTSLIYVVDKEGKQRLTYPYGFDPESIAEDIRHLV